MTREQIEALAALTATRLFLDEDGDLCRRGDGDNLVCCLAVKDRHDDYALLNPEIFRALPDVWNATPDLARTALDALAEVERLRGERLEALNCNARQAAMIAERDMIIARLSERLAKEAQK